MVKKPKVKVVGCETCLFRGGDVYPDPVDKKITRVYCKARYVVVDVGVMVKFCDHYHIQTQED